MYKVLNINGAVVDSKSLEMQLEKIASNHVLTQNSYEQTYPVPRMIENFEAIKQVYELLNNHLKLGIAIHPAGEWLLDNFYIIEETVKSIQKELTLKKYINFVGIENGMYKGFARIYVLAAEIVAYTDSNIKKETLEKYLSAYQINKTLSMDEIWNIGLFLQIAIIEKIRQICEIIYISQMQKYKVESIIERLVEKKDKNNLVYKKKFGIRSKANVTKYPFIEYMSYALKRYGKKAYSYLKILEETVQKSGTTVSDIIRKEHFSIAIQKVSMGNSITSIKEIQRINFLEIFEKLNGVEEILKSDPAKVYSKMDYKTKECYRNKIKEISKKTKISEIYIAKKVLELAKCKKEGTKKSHIGYYLIAEGISDLYSELQFKHKNINNRKKAKLYIYTIAVLSIALTMVQAICINLYVKNIALLIISAILLLIPSSEFVIQVINYILDKAVKPKTVPKIDFSSGIDEQNTTIVVIPTIIKSEEKVRELMKKLEVFYLANKSKNLYFALLGDCSQSKRREEPFDQEVIEAGQSLTQKLNEKYKNDGLPIFHFLYRSRTWNEKENCYIGWERKRGLLTQFNEYLLGNEPNRFRVNTIEEYKKVKLNSEVKVCDKISKIKYVITLDSDTELPLNSAFELVGAMAHILNKPVMDDVKNVVTEGHAIIQPRVGINLKLSYKNFFTKLFAGAGGIDCYTNAISDVYQDNFDEGIFTGKGIYDLQVFSNVLRNQIPENTVLSHDLLEGCYLRCGLATDILLIDGYPTKYLSFMNRLSRWTRGDWQIAKWLNNKKLNMLSKYKIFDNLRRSMLDALILINIFYIAALGSIYSNTLYLEIAFLIIVTVMPYLIDIFNQIIFRKYGEKKQKTFTPKIDGIKGNLARAVIALANIPYKAYICEIAKWKTIYRMCISHKHLLEWMTSEEAEKLSKTGIFPYYRAMLVNVILGIALIAFNILHVNIFLIVLGVLWIVAPGVICYISTTKKQKQPMQKLNFKEKEYLKNVAKNTWKYFKDYLTEENNYLIPDNYQEDRIPLVVNRTSSTNIGLSILAVISSCDMGFITKEEAVNLLKNIINVVYDLPKWNGHLYNWYNIKTKGPLTPRYISTVDSGNFVGYLYVLHTFLEQENVEPEFISKVESMIKNTDFSVLYSKENRLFSIGYNVEENKLTNSYYDLLASESRQASLVAIAHGDVPAKHWNNLSRTMTCLNKYKGLVSWSGTAFEYLMPNIIVPNIDGSIISESCKFAIMSQMEYSKSLGIPWGISEAAFNAKDLHSNYQYKAFGVPWLGLKRGLADEMVVASYGSILAVNEKPKEVVQNLKELQNYGMCGKYGFYESIDYTPARAQNSKIGTPVKTYMAHHQGLILLSINNLFNNNILQKRFMQNPEIEAIEVLLQEKMPEKFIITKESKEKPQKLKYKDYENYTKVSYNKIDKRLIRGNVISNANYTVALSQKGTGVSKYKDYYINRYKKTDDYPQGIFFYMKNISNSQIWSTSYNENLYKPIKYNVGFMPDKDEIERIDGNIKTKMKVTVAPNEALEIRRLEIENLGNDDEILEITSLFEPVLSRKEQDYAHPMFNNLFLGFEYDQNDEAIVVKRRKRAKKETELYLAVKLSTNCENVGDIEYEIDKEKLIGRENYEIPQMIKKSIPLSKKIGLVTEPIVCLKRTIKVVPQKKAYVDLILSVDENKQSAIENMQKYAGYEKVTRTFELSKARVEAESRYLGIKGKNANIYQKMLSYIIFDNPVKEQTMKLIPKIKYKQSDLWKYGISGDLPIILVKIKDVNDIYVVKEVIKAYEFFKSKNIMVDLVIINEEKYSYENYVAEAIESAIMNEQISYLKNINGGIFVLKKDEISKNDYNLFVFVAAIVINCRLGNLENELNDMEDEYLENYKEIGKEKEILPVEVQNNSDVNILENIEKLKYYNEYGAFSEDGKEFLIKANKANQLPCVWAHIMANKKFGTVVTENMGGYTWYKNSRLNRITAWHNDSVFNIPSEMIFIKDQNLGKKWSLGLSPMTDDKNYNIIYGFGYAKYIHECYGIYQENTVFVPKEDSVKINILKLKNVTPTKKKLKILYYTKPVLAEDEIKSNGTINLKYEANNNLVYAENLYNEEFKNSSLFISSSEKIKSYTGDKKFFFGNADLLTPDALNKVPLNCDNTLGKMACIAIETEVELESYSEKEIILTLGAEENTINMKDLAYKYSKVSNCKTELSNIKKYWDNLLGKINVNTPLESINIMLNGWTMYQTICCRLIARTGFYQSGGAYGFRDQLQDALGTKYLDSEILKKQILKHSKHQFIEGDVEHWWHEETQRGIRTKFSDDLLWLPFSVLEYINCTGDKSILNEETVYLKGENLKLEECERYERYFQSDVKESIYKHCLKAINRSLNFGEHNLPKIGSGDWNDGFSEVGSKGKGESVWLGFFLYFILNGFIPICKEMQDNELAAKYEEAKEKLKKALNTSGWDGRWYRRAYTDDGSVLGSMENEECRIDGISQSWSVISEAGDNDKKYISMQSLENHLVDKEIGIIKLLDPPFENGNLEPGYIKAYMPGVRENGGQYTHDYCG